MTQSLKAGVVKLASGEPQGDKQKKDTKAKWNKNQ